MLKRLKTFQFFDREWHFEWKCIKHEKSQFLVPHFLVHKRLTKCPKREAQKVFCCRSVVFVCVGNRKPQFGLCCATSVTISELFCGCDSFSFHASNFPLRSTKAFKLPMELAAQHHLKQFGVGREANLQLTNYRCSFTEN